MWAPEAFSGDIMDLKWEAVFLLRLLSGAVEKLVHKKLSVVRDLFELFCKASMNNIDNCF